MDEEPLYPIFRRICLVCHQPMDGHSFYSLYGSLVVIENGVPRTIHGCGDPVHFRCPVPGAPRRVSFHDTGYFGLSSAVRGVRNVAPGIDYNSRTGRYAARVDKKRLGTHATPDLAEAARQNYLRTLRAKEDPPAQTSTKPHRKRMDSTLVRKDFSK